MIKVWMHKKTGKLVLGDELYRNVSQSESALVPNYQISTQASVGYGLENEHGVMVVWPEKVLQYFTLIGEFE